MAIPKFEYEFRLRLILAEASKRCYYDHIGVILCAVCVATCLFTCAHQFSSFPGAFPMFGTEHSLGTPLVAANEICNHIVIGCTYYLRHSPSQGVHGRFQYLNLHTALACIWTQPIRSCHILNISWWDKAEFQHSHNLQIPRWKPSSHCFHGPEHLLHLLGLFRSA